MKDVMIEVENLCKLYQTGTIGTGTLSHDLNRWWHRIRYKEDPLSKRHIDGFDKEDSRYQQLWSLKEVSFRVGTGDVFGIIGRNGAGKSTLLKIISKITKPTSGFVRLNGRIASLLEVGTGFHPELTGKENIFLNGAILGMTKTEIKRKFDEIVNFSGVDKYINTPVKRYSSGMYVRLAFAVAAHLEPEILIVDEVLAVGDYEFQKKCLGKMKDVSSNQGRTVLFVSHNAAAIKQLCTNAILLDKGMLKAVGKVNEILSIYHEAEKDADEGLRKLNLDLPGFFTDWKLDEPSYENPHTCYTGDSCIFSFGFTARENFANCEIRFAIKYEDILISHASSLAGRGSNFSISPGAYRFRFKMDFPVRDAKFDIEVTFVSMGKVLDVWKSTTRLTVLDNSTSYVLAGVINPDFHFSVEQLLPGDLMNVAEYGVTADKL